MSLPKSRLPSYKIQTVSALSRVPVAVGKVSMRARAVDAVSPNPQRGTVPASCERAFDSFSFFLSLLFVDSASCVRQLHSVAHCI